MEFIDINNKSLFVVERHHEVLEAWNNAQGCNIFTLDYHTDTMPAFQTHSYLRTENKEYSLREAEMTRIEDELINNFKLGNITINSCIKKLKHDEHIDFAVRTGIANKVFSFGSKTFGSRSHNKRVFNEDCEGSYCNEPIIECTPLCLPNCKKTGHDIQCQKKFADGAIEEDFLLFGIKYIQHYESCFFNKYILDIDLDYFNTEKAFKPSHPNMFHHLIRNSDIITIAKESSCVQTRKLANENIDSSKILDSIILHIKVATS